MSSAELVVVAILVVLAVATTKLKAVGESSAWRIPAGAYYVLNNNE